METMRRESPMRAMVRNGASLRPSFPCRVADVDVGDAESSSVYL
jgi:hypothetical protein